LNKTKYFSLSRWAFYFILFYFIFLKKSDSQSRARNVPLEPSAAGFSKRGREEEREGKGTFRAR
jgi:hypothetical protein